jgi:hypothetical protein
MMDTSRAKKIFVVAAVAVVVVSAVLAIVFPYSTDPAAKVVWYKKVPGFAAMLGFVGCMIMVPLVKTFAKKVLQRPEEYYASFEERLGAMTGPAPGTSLADPSAPSEASDSHAHAHSSHHEAGHDQAGAAHGRLKAEATHG